MVRLVAGIRTAGSVIDLWWRDCGQYIWFGVRAIG